MGIIGNLADYLRRAKELLYADLAFEVFRAFAEVLVPATLFTKVVEPPVASRPEVAGLALRYHAEAALIATGFTP